MGRGILLLASGALLAAMAGCSLCHSCRCSRTLCPSRGDEMPLPEVERASRESAIQDVAASVGVSHPPDEALTPLTYRALAPLLCQCLAAKHAPTADGLDSQRRQLEQSSHARCACKAGICLCSCCGPARVDKSEKQRTFQASLLLFSALETRDHAAGAALEWYYQLAGTETKDDLITVSLKDGRKTLERIEQLKKLGIPLPAPIEDYRRQVVDLRLQKARNQITIAQLNSKLRLAMGYNSRHDWRIWPDPGTPSGETPVPLVPDVEVAVQLGLHQRPQLLLLRYAIANLDRDTLDSSRSLLQTIDPLLAMSNPGPSGKLLKILGKILHIQPGQEDEVQRVRAQLCDTLRERERTVEAEIREAVYELGARRETIELGRQAADSWQQRIDDLKKQQAQGLEGELSLDSAYLEWHKARGEVIKEYFGWKIAGVKLKQAQGILPAECGYSECKGNHHESHELHE